MAKITQGGGIPFAAGEEVLVNAEYGGAAWRMPLGELPFETVPEVALHGGCAEVFPPPEAAAVDPVQVLAEDRFLEGLAGPLCR